MLSGAGRKRRQRERQNLPLCPDMVLSTVFSDLSQKKISDGIHEKPDSVVYRKEMFAGKLTASLHKKHYRCSWAAISRTYLRRRQRHHIAFTEVVGVKPGFRMEVTASLAASPAEHIMRTGGTAFRNLSGMADKADVLPFLIDHV